MASLQNAVLGAGLAFAAAIQPGPLQAFLMSRAVAGGWRRTLPACFSPLISDGPIALVAVLVLGQLSTTAQQLLRVGGGVLLLVLAGTLLRKRRSSEEGRGSAPRTLLEAIVINLLNPGPYLGWALVLGPLTVTSWRLDRVSAVSLLVAFYGVMISTNVALVASISATRPTGPVRQRLLIAAAASVLAALGVWMLATGLSVLWRV